MVKKNIKQKTVVEQLMKEIRNMIIDGTYKYNDKIPTEQELAEHFGVSRTSVREAIKSLSYLGILESHTSRGTRVSENNSIAEQAASWSVILGYEKMREVFELGTALDTQVIIILLDYSKNKKLHASFKKEMDAITAKMNDFAKENNLEQYKQEFSNYFRTLYGASNNSVFIALNECIDSLIVNKVCDAYFKTNNLVQAAEYLSNLWGFILSGSLPECVKTIQEFGEFTYKIFVLCKELDNDTNRL